MLFSFVGDAAVLVALLLISFVSGFLAAGARPLLFRTPWITARAAFSRPKRLIPRFDILGQVEDRLDRMHSSQGI
jgi:hypothetical protein